MGVRFTRANTHIAGINALKNLDILYYKCLLFQSLVTIARLLYTHTGAI